MIGDLTEAQRKTHEGLAIKGRGFFYNEPVVPFGGEEAHEAFWALNSSRSMGMGPGGIPFLAIDRYAARYGIEDFERFHRLILAMDSVYLEYVNQRRD